MLLFCVNHNLTWKGYFLILFHKLLRSAYILNRLSVVTVVRYPGPNQVRRFDPFFNWEGDMKKDWVELDHDGYGEMMWYESSTLCWLGGEAYAIKDCRRMDTRTVEKTSDITLYKSNAEAVFAWKKRKRYYESYREIKESFVRGELADNHVFFLGLPGEILKKCGFPEHKVITLTSSRLKQKSTQENHSFSPLNIKGLDKALQTPVAVFEYARSGNNDMQNVIVDITQNEKHFLAGIVFNKKQNGFEVSNIRGLFPKDDYQWLHWVEQGKMIYGNKEKIQALSTQRRIDLAEVSSQDARISSDIHCLDSIDTILGKFGSVNDIFTQEFSFYAQQKELYSIYRKIHASFAWDAVYEDDARFYAEKIFKAIHGTRETEKIMDEGIENMQANGGRSQAAMEAGYGYEQANNIPPETEETEEESFGFENFTEEALLHLAEISPKHMKVLKRSMSKEQDFQQMSI